MHFFLLSSPNLILHITPQSLTKCKHSIHLSLADIVLLLLIKRYHSQGDTTYFCKLCLCKAPCLSYHGQLWLPFCVISCNHFICCVSKLALIRLMRIYMEKMLRSVRPSFTLSFWLRTFRSRSRGLTGREVKVTHQGLYWSGSCR